MGGIWGGSGNVPRGGNYTNLQFFSFSEKHCLTFQAMLAILSMMGDVSKMKKFGSFLKSLREKKQFTLREVEKRTDISNAYLSQLESGKIKQPSPVHLYKLSEVYNVTYESLMDLAGYPVPKSKRKGPAPQPSLISRRVGKITDEEEEALIEYLSFLRSRTQREK